MTPNGNEPVHPARGFHEYENYLLACCGIGDILNYLNAFEALGRENNRKINLFIQPKYFYRLEAICNIFDVPHIYPHILDRINLDTDRWVHAFGMRCSWIQDWPRKWGVKNYGNDYMIKPKISNCGHINNNLIGVSFTLNFMPERNIRVDTKISILKKIVQLGKDVLYFGYDKNKDGWLIDCMPNIRLAEHDLIKTAMQMKTCREVIGVDSGMAFMAAYLRVPTRVLIGRSLGFLSKTFSGIQNAKVMWEDELEF